MSYEASWPWPSARTNLGCFFASVPGCAERKEGKGERDKKRAPSKETSKQLTVALQDVGSLTKGSVDKYKAPLALVERHLAVTCGGSSSGKWGYSVLVTE